MNEKMMTEDKMKMDGKMMDKEKMEKMEKK